MSNLARRISEIERNAGKGRRLFVTRDGGTFTEGGRTYTRTEIDEIAASGFAVVVLQVVHETAQIAAQG